MSFLRQVRCKTQQSRPKQSKIIGRIGFDSCILVHVLVLCFAVRKQTCRHHPPPPPPNPHSHDCYNVIKSFLALTLTLYPRLLSIFTPSLYLFARRSCSFSIYAYCSSTPPHPSLPFTFISSYSFHYFCSYTQQF